MCVLFFSNTILLNCNTIPFIVIPTTLTSTASTSSKGHCRTHSHCPNGPLLIQHAQNDRRVMWKKQHARLVTTTCIMMNVNISYEHNISSFWICSRFLERASIGVHSCLEWKHCLHRLQVHEFCLRFNLHKPRRRIIHLISTFSHFFY